ncbi:MAG: hypothetical protein NZL90_04545 [Aquificaceae bacterium]|nr:hypothetical protein [Aquificaceae bacterium]MDW8236862.1 hypothetical protein [Aquificaceae bacterium]
MRFSGIPSEERAIEIAMSIKEGEWTLCENQSCQSANREEAVAWLKNIVSQISTWKKQNPAIPPATCFVFVHTPSEPVAFKIYDLSSLGCSFELSPPRWKAYLKGYEI